MLKFFVLSAALFSIALTAAAQESTVAFDASSLAAEPAAPAVPASLFPADREPWQIGVGFQFLHFNVLGTSFHDFGYKTDVTRYFTNWFGVEGTAIAGFGHTGGTPNLVAKSFFIGGGPHVSIRNTPRFEPWVHLLVGWERFRFTQTAVLGANSSVAFMPGGGLDYKFGGGRLYWRFQGDYIGAKIGSSFAADYAFGTGLVLNF